MIRKLMASSAALALISAGAFTVAQAQDDPAQPIIVQEESAAAAPATEAAPDAAASEDVLTPEQPTLASVYIGRSVFSSEDPESDNIGDVNDLIVGEDGTVTHAVVGVGGFLGIGEKDVAVPFDELKVVEGDGDIRLIYAATREQLEAAPALERTAYDPIARFQEEQAAALQSAAPGGVTDPLAPAPAGDLTAAPMAEPAAPADEQAAAPEALVPAEDAATADQDVAATETAPTGEQAMAPEEQAAATEVPATGEAAPADDQMAATETPPASEAVTPEEEQTAAIEAPATDEAATDEAAPADEQIAASETPPTGEQAAPAPSGEVVFLTASADQILSSDIVGNDVYGAEDESIGKVSDLVVQDEGTPPDALVDVGGFLGVGEKTVAIPFGDLSFSEPEDGSGVRIAVAMSKAELEQLPAIQPTGDVTTSATETPALGSPPAGDLAATEPPVTAPAPTEGVEPADEMAAQTEEPAASTEEPAIASGEQPMDADQLTTGSIGGTDGQKLAASTLIGAEVFGSDDTSLGKISDLVFDKGGALQAAVVNVGGFLGIGAKPVAIEFGSLTTRIDEYGVATAMLDASREQLDAAPTFDPGAEEAASVQ